MSQQAPRARRGPDGARIRGLRLTAAACGLGVACALAAATAIAAEAEPGAATSAAMDATPPGTPSEMKAEPVVVARLEPADDTLTGEQIYQRVLDNRFDTYIQESKLISGDRGGNEQFTALKMWFKNFRDEEGKPHDGVILSKALVRYTEPFDVRHSGYLVVANLGRANDQFVYRNSSRKVRRVNLRGEAVFGTDFSFEDVIPREIEDATYLRKEDAVVAGIPCYTVEAIPRPDTNSEYSRFLVYVDKTRWVPLRTRYWDEHSLEVKELTTAPDSIVELEGVWVPMKATMRHHQLESFTTLDIEELTPNPDLTRTTFDLRRLEGR